MWAWRECNGEEDADIDVPTPPDERWCLPRARGLWTEDPVAAAVDDDDEDEAAAAVVKGLVGEASESVSTELDERSNTKSACVPWANDGKLPEDEGFSMVMEDTGEEVDDDDEEEEMDDWSILWRKKKKEKKKKIN